MSGKRDDPANQRRMLHRIRLPNRHIYLPELDNNLHHELDRAVAEGLSDGFKDALAVPNEESVRKEVLPEVDS